MNKFTKKYGFPISETIIVILMFVMFVAIFITGKILLTQARIRSSISQIQNVESAIYKFNISYGKKPGDFQNASIWGINVCGIAGKYGLNGNGDGLISNDYTPERVDLNDDIVESYASWCHLYLAELLEYNITPMTNKNEIPLRDINLPPSLINSNAIMHIAYDPLEKHNVIYIGNPTKDMVILNATLRPSDAYSIDQKIDNKTARSGRVRVYKGIDIDSDTSCIDKYGSYNLNIKSRICYLKYILAD